jgi:hypothetical protein
MKVTALVIVLVRPKVLEKLAIVPLRDEAADMTFLLYEAAG